MPSSDETTEINTLSDQQFIFGGRKQIQPFFNNQPSTSLHRTKTSPDPLQSTEKTQSNKQSTISLSDPSDDEYSKTSAKWFLMIETVSM